MSDNATTQDYAVFDPHAYLQEYYADIGPENDALLRFLARAYAGVPADSIVLDLGGGPTLYACIVAAGRVREIHLADYSAANLEEVRRWLRHDPRAFDWRPFIRATLAIEGKGTSEREVAAREARVREIVTHLLPCDVKHPCPLGESGRCYDVVMSNFCAEAAAADRAEWQVCMANIASLVKPGGRLILSAIKGAKSYGAGDATFAAVYLTEEDLLHMLGDAGFPRSVILETTPADRPERHYTALMFTTATKLPQGITGR